MAEPEHIAEPRHDAPPSPPAPSDEPETEAGFDRTLIREFLRLSPEERLAWHDSMVRLVLELRDGRSG